jgi:cell division protein ZapA (FtsZ GTPase activity inhibitor)
MSELLAINITIADRSYRLKLSPDDEAHVRKTVKLINEKIIEFKTNFSGKDMQDYIAMSLLWFATQFEASVQTLQQEDAVKEELQSIQKLLSAIHPDE